MARTERVNVPLEKDLRKKIQQWAAGLGISESDFCRRLVLWGVKQFSHSPTFLFSGNRALIGRAAATKGKMRRGKEAT